MNVSVVVSFGWQPNTATPLPHRLEQQNPHFAVRKRKSVHWGREGGGILHRAKVLSLYPDKHGFAADFCQLTEIKRS